MYKIIDAMSLRATKSELDLFQLPPTQVVVQNSRWKEINLRNACTNTGPYDFQIEPNPQYLHLSKNYLLIELKITKPNGNNLIHDPANADVDPLVGPINLIGKTFIKQVKLSLNGTEVFDSGDKYAYRAYLETELNYGFDAANSHLQVAHYFPDTPADQVDTNDNTGLQTRATPFRQSASVILMAPIHCDLFTQNRYMVNNVDLRLTIYRNSDAFCLMSPGAAAAQTYRIYVNTMRWYVKAVELSSAVGLALEKALLVNTAKYPIRRVEIKTIHLDPGRRETPENALFAGQIPRRLVIGCVDADAYNGIYAKSPFNFKNYNIDEVSVTAAGQTYPSKPLSLDFAANRYSTAFIQLFEGLGISDDNKGNGITLAKFRQGWCLFAFDLSPDEDDGNHWDLLKEGATSVNIHFAQAIPAGGIEVIVYAEFDGLITIDHHRNTFTDYKA